MLNTKYPDFSITITRYAYNKMMLYAKLISTEISGLGFINDERVIYDVIIFKQENSAGSTDLNMKDVTDYITKLIKKEPDKLKDMKLWWHSHANGGVSWSTVDDDNIEDQMKDFNDLISIVVNRKRDYKCRRDVMFEGKILTFDSIVLTIEEEDTVPISDMIYKKSKKLVKGLFDTHPTLNAFAFKKEDDDIKIEIKTDFGLPDAEKEIIEAEIKEKCTKPVAKLFQRNTHKVVRHVNNMSLVTSEDDPMTGWSNGLGITIFRNTKGKYIFITKGAKKNSQKGVVLSPTQLKARKKEIETQKESTSISYNLFFNFDKKKISRIVDDDEDKIVDNVTSEEVAELYYSDTKKAFWAIDLAINNDDIAKILRATGLIKTSAFDDHVVVTENKPIVILEFIDHLVSFGYQEYEIYEFLNLLEFRTIEVDPIQQLVDYIGGGNESS